jgi:type II secretory pathway pseudopilin PulG
MEILLVLAIIVMAAAAVAPSMQRVAKNQALKAAASEVRAELTKTHVQAMKTGRIYVFQYELGGGKYKTQPWAGDDAELEGNGADLAAAPVVPTVPGQTNPGERSLPEGITFALGDAAIESRGEKIEQELGTTGDGVTWSRPILFFPDGSSADAFLVVANERDVGIRLDLRGLTGAVRVSDLKSLQELESGAITGQ